jgi:hypothetical protein
MINEFGLPNAIDTMMYRLAGIGRTMFTYPPLVEAPLANYSQEVDSDIQRCARPLLGVETYVEDHAKYLMNLCSVYNYTFNRTTSMPEEIDPKGVYMMEYHDYQGSIESPQGFDHYWLDQTRTVMMPCQLRRVVEASEGWRLSKQGCFEIDGLIQG